jgi:hypothetical protein
MSEDETNSHQEHEGSRHDTGEKNPFRLTRGAGGDHTAKIKIPDQVKNHDTRYRETSGDVDYEQPRSTPVCRGLIHAIRKDNGGRCLRKRGPQPLSLPRRSKALVGHSVGLS